MQIREAKPTPAASVFELSYRASHLFLAQSEPASKSASFGAARWFLRFDGGPIEPFTWKCYYLIVALFLFPFVPGVGNILQITSRNFVPTCVRREHRGVACVKRYKLESFNKRIQILCILLLMWLSSKNLLHHIAEKGWVSIKTSLHQEEKL